MDQNPPLVSIGIPTYNRAGSYLPHALRCAVGQTYTNIEIIVSDNCSPDNTETVVKDLNDSRIRYFRQNENIGALRNRNFCLEQARGKYFVVLLDDDLIDDDFIATCMNAVDGYGEPGIILTGVRQVDSKGHVLSAAHNTLGGCSTAEFMLGWFDGELPLYLCSTVFSTKGLKELGGFHAKANKYGGYDDVVAYVQLAAKYGRIDIFDVKASFRRHDANIGDAAHYAAWCKDSLYLLDVMCNAVPEHAAQVRERGLVYFSARNYNRVSGVQFPLKRLSAYLTVYRIFGYRYSPVTFLYKQHIYPMINALKRKLGNS
jgi:glycosyltransferase involved in cell wall biosynthesis